MEQSTFYQNTSVAILQEKTLTENGHEKFPLELKKMKLTLGNQIITIENVYILNKFQTESDHRLVRAQVILDLKLERLKLIKNPRTGGNNINNQIENSDRCKEKLHDETNSF